MKKKKGVGRPPNSATPTPRKDKSNTGSISERKQLLCFLVLSYPVTFFYELSRVMYGLLVVT